VGAGHQRFGQELLKLVFPKPNFLVG